MSNIGIDLHLMTRGYSRDYRFIGKEQVDRWWMKYSEWVRFEAPTIIVENRKFFVSGIVSGQRRDRVGTPIRYTLAGEVLNSDTCEDEAIEIAINFIAMATDGLKKRGDFSELAKSFDMLAADRIESALADDDDATLGILEILKAQLKEQKRLPLPALTPNGRWYCEANDRGFDQLLAIAASTIRGSQEGLAAYLNIAEGKDAQIALADSRLGCIVVENGPNAPTSLPKSKNKEGTSSKLKAYLGFSLVLLLAMGVILVGRFNRSRHPTLPPAIVKAPTPPVEVSARAVPVSSVANPSEVKSPPNDTPSEAASVSVDKTHGAVDINKKPAEDTIPSPAVVVPPQTVPSVPTVSPKAEDPPSENTRPETAPESVGKPTEQVDVTNELTKQIRSVKESKAEKL